MEQQKKEVLNELLEIDCYNIAKKLGFISENNNKITEALLAKTIRCLDYETTIPKTPDINYIITIFALIWEYIDHSKYNLQKIAVKFLSRIGYLTSAIITDKHFDKTNCIFSSLESPLDDIIKQLNQKKYEISIESNKFILTKFQMDIWNSMDNDKLIGISAPTSAGKSFVILLKLLYKLKREHFNIIYIVPTLSLLNQVTEDFSKKINELKIKNCIIANTYDENYSDDKNSIFILTQEKAISIFSDENNKFQKDTVLVVDEIQNIERIISDTDERSKILYDTLNELRYKANLKQIILSGPRINNVDKIASALFGQRAKNISSNDSPVLNLTYSIFKSDRNRYQLKQYCGLRDKPFVIDITNSDMIKGYGQKHYTDKFITYINSILKSLSDSQNIIFVPTASTARKVACSINISNEINKEIKELINYYKETVNNNYSLCKSLEKGIIYHHGRLPHHVRRTIEKAMHENFIKNIVCTTTLLQGINLSAQNIIIRNPNLYIKKRQNQTVELTNYEMANLRGRAGRLLKDFIGRTFVLDEASFTIVEGYEENNLFNNTTKDLPNDYGERYEKYKNYLLNSLLDEDIDNEEKPNEIPYKDLKIYICQSILKNGKQAKQKMEQVGINLTKEQVAAIKLKLDKLTIPKTLCYKNRYWDPFVLEFIYKNYKDEVPTSPLERGVIKKFDNMLKFLRDNTKTKSMYNKYIPEKYRKGKLRVFLRNLCLYWTKEVALSDILPKVVKNEANTEDVIEDTIDLLQNTISYNIPLLLKPIIDIKNSNSIFLTSMQSGAYNNITKTMIEMGVPRECAIYLYKQLFNKINLDQSDQVNIKNNIVNILKANIDSMNYWIKAQIEFLTKIE